MPTDTLLDCLWLAIVAVAFVAGIFFGWIGERIQRQQQERQQQEPATSGKQG